MENNVQTFFDWRKELRDNDQRSWRLTKKPATLFFLWLTPKAITHFTLVIKSNNTQSIGQGGYPKI